MLVRQKQTRYWNVRSKGVQRELDACNGELDRAIRQESARKPRITRIVYRGLAQGLYTALQGAVWQA